MNVTMKHEHGLTKNQIIAELSKSPHGKLTEYLTVGQAATQEHPEFMAHLIAWDLFKGQVRDAKVALPVISLSVKEFPEELAENSLAHLACLNPREFLRAVRFSKDQHVRKQAIVRLAGLYLRQREQNAAKWDRMALQHRAVLKELYALTHTKPGSDHINVVLYGRDLDKKKASYPVGSLFHVLATLKDLNPSEAAGMIMKFRIPFLMAMGALGKKAQEPDLVLALIKSMTPTELTTNAKMLERLGMKKNPALRGAFDEAVGRAAKSGANILKTSVAADTVEDEELKENLRGLQEKQIQKFSGVEGNWLVLGDKSGSMFQAIEVSRHVAGTLAKMVKGKVWLTFFDTTPQTLDVSGTALDIIEKATKYIMAQGNTSIGCGLQRAVDERLEVDGIAIVSDGEENSTPYFHQVYKAYYDVFGKQVPVYFYHVSGSGQPLIRNLSGAGIDLQVFDLRGQKLDYYSLPNLVKTMRTNRYSLIDEIMASRLLKLSDVFKSQGKEVQTSARLT